MATFGRGVQRLSGRLVMGGLAGNRGLFWPFLDLRRVLENGARIGPGLEVFPELGARYRENGARFLQI